LSTNQIEDFNYVNLQEIDPAFETLPTNLYTLQVQKAELKEFVYKPGSEKAGQTGSFVKFQFVVVDHDTYSGRRVFETLFPSTFTFKGLRRLMDATGVVQEAGAPLTEWLGTLTNESPKFKIMVEQAEDVDKNGVAKNTDFKGNPAKINRLRWNNVQPA
jgi:hypothetical protein